MTPGTSPRINSPCSQDQLFSIAWDRDFPSIVYLQFYRMWSWSPDADDNMWCRTWGRAPWSIVRSLYSSQEPVGVFSLHANLSRHNTFPDSKCFDLKQKCSWKRVTSSPKKTRQRDSCCENHPRFQMLCFLKSVFLALLIFSWSCAWRWHTLIWPGWH